jgi:hypothetical protein
VEAARLLGAAEAAYAGAGLRVDPADRWLVDRTMATLHNRLDSAELHAALAEGQAMRPEAALGDIGRRHGRAPAGAVI